jgi:hypothetical protein
VTLPSSSCSYFPQDRYQGNNHAKLYSYVRSKTEERRVGHWSDLRRKKMKLIFMLDTLEHPSLTVLKYVPYVQCWNSSAGICQYTLTSTTNCSCRFWTAMIMICTYISTGAVCY